LEEVNGAEVVIEAIAKINKGPAFGYKGRAFTSVTFVGDGSFREQAEEVGIVTGMMREPWKYLADAEVVIASSYLAILEAAAMGKKIIAVANNPLKRDYLESHPLRRYFEVAENSNELANVINKGPALPRQGRALRAWARGQTAERLANVYEELWNSKLA
jgi:glycosyltransferase involved in cell wall biosynthesis